MHLPGEGGRVWSAWGLQCWEAPDRWAHLQSQIIDSASEAENKPPALAPATEPEEPVPARPQEEAEETWEEKEDKVDPEKGKSTDQKYGYKEGEASGGASRPLLGTLGAAVGAGLCWVQVGIPPGIVGFDST